MPETDTRELGERVTDILVTGKRCRRVSGIQGTDGNGSSEATP